MIYKYALVLTLILQACSSQPSNNDINSPATLEARDLPNCSNGQIPSQSEMDIFKGRTAQNVSGWNRIARCYFNRGELGVAELFYDKTLKADSSNFNALSTLFEIAMRKHNYAQASGHLKKLQEKFSNKVEIWEQTARLALNFYDLPMASLAVAKLSKYSSKKFYNLYYVYLLALKDQKAQALSKWKIINPDSYKSMPEAAFTAAYLGYLLDDKIKARKFLNTAGEDSNPEMFDKLSRLVK